MKIVDALRDRVALATLLDPSDPRYVTGSEEDRKKARAEWHRQRYVGQVLRSDLEEIPRADLERRLPGTLEDTRTGKLYHPRLDGLIDLDYTPAAIAYFVDGAGLPVLLEAPTGPKTVDELEAQRAAKEQQRAERLLPRVRR